MGARAMTSTSGPGVSLMAEFTGLGYYAEVPAVIFDIQRVGPSTGLPTRTAQQDILTTAVLSHGDTKHPLLLPASVAECYTMAMEAFDLAERLQTPVFVMSDLDLGMNTWMSTPFDYPTKPLDRGKLGMNERDAVRRVRSRIADAGVGRVAGAAHHNGAPLGHEGQGRAQHVGRLVAGEREVDHAGPQHVGVHDGPRHVGGQGQRATAARNRQGRRR